MGGRRADPRRKAFRTRGKPNQDEQISEYAADWLQLLFVFNIVLRIRMHVFGRPDPDPLVRGTDPALDLDPSIIKQK
jgi:hypothetical protein